MTTSRGLGVGWEGEGASTRMVIKLLFSHLWGWVVGDMQKGVQKTEQMLTKGTSLTGIGELVSSPLGVRYLPRPGLTPS